jgi:cytochrome c-type biogenesis protein CcmF
LSELFTDNKITVGPPYYNQTVGPLLVPLVLLMGIAPLVSWRAASLPALGRLTWLPAALATIVIVLLAALHAAPIFALVGFWIVTFTAATTLIEYGRGAQTRHTAAQESYPLALWNLIGRNRRRYGGYLIHIAVVLIALGIIGTNFYQVETQRSLEPGQALTINDYTLRFVDLHLKPTAEPDKQIVEAEAAVTLGNGSLVTLRPFQEIYENGERMTPPVLIMSFKEDLYVLLAGWEGKAATFKVYVNPLVNWMWLGGILFIIGTLVAAWPTQEKA